MVTVAPTSSLLISTYFEVFFCAKLVFKEVAFSCCLDTEVLFNV